jgi:hypothetical protein
MADLGKTLMIVGIGLFAGAVAWWYLFFEQVFGEDVKKASECFYYTTKICSLGEVVGVVGQIPPYSPVSFWAAVVALGAGVALLALAPRKS